jgi:hypothetical protein
MTGTGITTYSCPMPNCGWQRDITPEDGPMGVELAMREHVDEHSPLQYLRALLAAQQSVEAGEQVIVRMSGEARGLEAELVRRQERIAELTDQAETALTRAE